MATATAKPDVLELDSRTSDGLTVTLLYHPKVRRKADRVTLVVEDHGERFETIVPPAEAREAFWHPFIYLANCTSDDPEQHEGDTCPVHETPAEPPISRDEWRRMEGLEGDDPVPA